MDVEGLWRTLVQGLAQLGLEHPQGHVFLDPLGLWRPWRLSERSLRCLGQVIEVTHRSKGPGSVCPFSGLDLGLLGRLRLPPYHGVAPGVAADAVQGVPAGLIAPGLVHNGVVVELGIFLGLLHRTEELVQLLFRRHSPQLVQQLGVPLLVVGAGLERLLTRLDQHPGRWVGGSQGPPFQRPLSESLAQILMAAEVPGVENRRQLWVFVLPVEPFLIHIDRMAGCLERNFYGINRFFQE